MAFSHISVRPRHPQADAAAQEAHKKNFADLVAAAIPAAAQGKPIELWWQDEARIGQQGSLTRIWGERGSRPTAPRDQRYKWAYLFGAVCPARGVGAGLVLPHANIHAMTLHLQEISTQVQPRGLCGADAGRRGLAPNWATAWWCPKILACCICRPIRPNSIRLRTSGSSCDRTISAIASTRPMRRSSTPVASPGTNSPQRPPAIRSIATREWGQNGHFMSRLVLFINWLRAVNSSPR